MGDWARSWSGYIFWMLLLTPLHLLLIHSQYSRVTNKNIVKKKSDKNKSTLVLFWMLLLISNY